jgi:RES domain-containing protein
VEVTAADVPGWDRADLVASRACGDAWVENRRTAVLIVPSVVARADRNVLINLEHPSARKIRHCPPQPVLWDGV